MGDLSCSLIDSRKNYNSNNKAELNGTRWRGFRDKLYSINYYIELQVCSLLFGEYTDYFLIFLLLIKMLISPIVKDLKLCSISINKQQWLL